ncbi:hypothetical protein BGX26_009640 [Mortierella sp. AD094]|nr:hypothetical protein BGX26_009640 [Mortierella sp. AD094]
MDHRRNPLDLLEVRIHIAQYLSKPQLAAASAVCKCWNATFSTFLYGDIIWDGTWRSPCRERIIAHAADIRYLKLDGTIGQPSDHFPWKTATGIKRLLSCICFLDTYTVQNLSKLIRLNRGLLEFQDDSGIYAETQECMNALSCCPNLKKLSVKYADFERTEATELFYRICTRLEELEVCYSSVSDGEHLSNWSQFPSIKSLRFDYFVGPSTSQLLEFIHKCPRLESLHWNLTCGDFPVSEICQLPSTYCRRLTNLSFRNQDGPYLTDIDLVEILNSYPILTGFSVHESGFGPLAFQSLRRHFGRLTSLDLDSSLNITSVMVQEIMTSCPELISFCAPSLEVGSIVGVIRREGKTGEDSEIGGQTRCQQEWTCLNLRELKVFICGLESAPAELQQLVLQQLSTLKKLEALKIGHYDGKARKVPDGVDLRLEAGLDILRGLKRLRVIEFRGLQQHIDELEIQWMLREWPNLKQVRGVIHPFKTKRRKLTDMLRPRGIEVISG